jgi:PH domain/GTPase-activator protein for Ras-like GTPase
MHLDREVGKKYPGSSKSAVGGYIFLRFFCPAIVAPESAGLMPEGGRLSRDSRRVVILASKVIQNLANGILSFSKEGYMSVLDEYLGAAASRLDCFLETLLRCPSSGVQEAKPRRKPLQAATLLAIAQHLKAHIHNIGQYLALDPESRNSVRSFRSAEKRGFLKKRGEGFRNWRKRWFILKDNFLYYFRNEMDPSITGAIPLENYTLEPTTSSADGFEFEIRTPQRTYEIKVRILDRCVCVCVCVCVCSVV